MATAPRSGESRRRVLQRVAAGAALFGMAALLLWLASQSIGAGPLNSGIPATSVDELSEVPAEVPQETDAATAPFSVGAAEAGTLAPPSSRPVGSATIGRDATVRPARSRGRAGAGARAPAPATQAADDDGNGPLPVIGTPAPPGTSPPAPESPAERGNAPAAVASTAAKSLFPVKKRRLTESDLESPEGAYTLPPPEARVVAADPLLVGTIVYPDEASLAAARAAASTPAPTANLDGRPDADGSVVLDHDATSPPAPVLTPHASAPPLDAVALFPFEQAAWERDYIPRDTLPFATNGGRMFVKDLPRGWSPKRANPPLSSLTRGALLNDTSEDAKGEVLPIVWVAHLADAFADSCPRTVKAKLQYYKPAAVVVVSDEHGRSHCLHAIIARFSGTVVHAVLRQYSPRVTRIASANVHQVPLGYMATGTTLPPALHRNALRRASTRAFAWAFVGNQKGGRRDMIMTVRRWLKPGLASIGGYSTEKMMRAYAEAQFVLSPRGFQRLDCFRQYEASRVGAIPVVVGSQREVRATFGDYVGFKPDRLPPWVFATDWGDAVAQMKVLIADPALLDARQRMVLEWWDRANYEFRRALYDALQKKRKDTEARRIP